MMGGASRSRSDLTEYVRTSTLVDTHEHLAKEPVYLNRADILCDLFDNYIPADLLVAGADPAAVRRLLDSSDPDLAGRFGGVREAWEKCLHTGYGEAVQIIGRAVYGMEEITPRGIEDASPRAAEIHQPGQRLRLLRDVARLDHVQIDDSSWPCPPDLSGPEFFLYDMSWALFSQGALEPKALDDLRAHTGVQVGDSADLREAMGLLFERYGPCAIAVKSQHAYKRTLAWQPREEADADRILKRLIAGAAVSPEEQNCLGDWCLARGVELMIEHNLPFKIHTGYYAGHNYMPIERIRPGLLCDLLMAFPEARFVLMHIGYPYGEELIALAKHFSNVYVDLCWAWSIDPCSTADFVRRFIHAVPANKLFAFGGDTGFAGASLAYAQQCREWLARTLQGEIDAGVLSERAAIRLARLWMGDNQRECFDIEGTRAAIRDAISEPAADAAPVAVAK
jgi:uncharacterized protein